MSVDLRFLLKHGALVRLGFLPQRKVGIRTASNHPMCLVFKAGLSDFLGAEIWKTSDLLLHSVDFRSIILYSHVLAKTLVGLFGLHGWFEVGKETGTILLEHDGVDGLIKIWFLQLVPAERSHLLGDRLVRLLNQFVPGLEFYELSFQVIFLEFLVLEEKKSPSELSPSEFQLLFQPKSAQNYILILYVGDMLFLRLSSASTNFLL